MKVFTGLIGGLFGGGDQQSNTPALPPPVTQTQAAATPTPSVATADKAVTDRESADAAKRRKGRTAAIFTTPGGAGTPNTAAKALLGE